MKKSELKALIKECILEEAKSAFSPDTQKLIDAKFKELKLTEKNGTIEPSKLGPFGMMFETIKYIPNVYADETGIAITINWKYTHPGGGSNGYMTRLVYYFDKKKWEQQA